MKIIFTLLCFSICYLQNSFCQTFSMIYDDPVDGHTANSMAKTVDGGLIVCGNSTLLYATIYKIDSLGTLVWSKNIGTTNGQTLKAITATNDSCFLITGSIFDSPANSYDIFVLKIDVNGNILWSTSIPEPGFQEGMSIEPTFDGGCIVAGYKLFSPSPYSKLLVLKFDSAGSVQWYNEMIKGTQENMGVVIRQLPDSNFILGGFVQNLTANSANGFLCKLSNSTSTPGAVVWSRNYNQTSQEFFRVNDIGILNDGIITINESPFALIVMKTDLTGIPVWAFSIPNNGRSSCTNCGPYQLSQTNDGNLIFGASAMLQQLSVLVKIDTSGNFIWARSLSNLVLCVKESNDHGIFTLGNGPFITTADPYFAINKTDSSGFAGICTASETVVLPKIILHSDSINFTIIPNFNLSSILLPHVSNFLLPQQNSCGDVSTGMNEFNFTNAAIFPNPSNGFFTVDLGNCEEHVEVLVSDLSGQIIYKENVDKASSGKFQISRQLETGVYVLLVRSASRDSKFKLIIIKH